MNDGSQWFSYVLPGLKPPREGCWRWKLNHSSSIAGWQSGKKKEVGMVHPWFADFRIFHSHHHITKRVVFCWRFPRALGMALRYGLVRTRTTSWLPWKWSDTRSPADGSSRMLFRTPILCSGPLPKVCQQRGRDSWVCVFAVCVCEICPATRSLPFESPIPWAATHNDRPKDPRRFQRLNRTPAGSPTWPGWSTAKSRGAQGSGSRECCPCGLATGQLRSQGDHLWQIMRGQQQKWAKFAVWQKMWIGWF